MRSLLLSLSCSLALAALGCIQTPTGGTGSGAGGSSGGTRGAGTTGSGTTATTGQGTTSGSTTTNPNCHENGGNSPALSCALAQPDAGPVWASAAVEIDCSVGAGETPTRYEVVTNPSYTVVDSHSLTSTQQAWVTVVPGMLPSTFPDSTVTATVTAHFCTAAPSTATVTWSVVGNTLIADTSTSIRSFASDGTEVQPFLGPTQVPGPAMVARLKNGNFLAGCAPTTACTHSLQVFSPAGALVSTFDDTDHAGNPLWPMGVRPWGAAEDANGNVWVSGFKGQDSAGVLLVFTGAGSYRSQPDHPADPTKAIAWWVPLGIARLADNSMVVAMGGSLGNEPYLTRYAGADPTQPTLIHLGWETCSDTGGPTPTCQMQNYGNGSAAGLLISGGNLLVTSTFSTPSQVMAYSDPGLSLSGASAKRGTSGDDWYNAFLGPITPFGTGYLVGGNFTYDCVYLIAGTTLYPPASTDPQGGCWLGGSAAGSVAGVTHLTAP